MQTLRALRVSKCLWYFNLQKGFLMYAFAALILRMVLVGILCFTMLVIGWPSASPEGDDSLNAVAIVSAIIGGWNVVTVICLGLSIIGIVQKKLVLLFPCIVVLVMVIVIHIVYVIYAMLQPKPFSAIFIAIGMAQIINVYVVICLKSLYQDIKEYQDSLGVDSLTSTTPE